MVNSKSGAKGKDIWSLFTPEQLVVAIAHLGDRIQELERETWRFNVTTRLSTSLWAQVIEELKVDHNEKIRHSLYEVWRKNRCDIKNLVKQELKKINRHENDGDNDDIIETEEVSLSNREISNLVSNPSLPLPQPPNTRSKQANDVDADNSQNALVNETSLVLTPIEWKAIFSNTNQKMKDDWRKLLYTKLTSSGTGITCSVNFGSAHIKEGERKHACRFFWCVGKCSAEKCKRVYCIILQNEPDENTSALFLVQISGKENHDIETETFSRQLRGEERFHVGKRANEIGPLAVFHERVEAADENLLAVGNYTGCETIETIKKAAADYRKKMHIDENAFMECRIVASTYRMADVTSTTVKGYIQVVGEMPFRVHLFSEPQIERYITYCKKEKYSFVHIDSTGGVLKPMQEQNQSYLYAIIFKDGTDCINTIALAHALLTDHTVPSISYFFGNLAYNIALLKNKLVLPSFFVIDFSAAIMNSILQAFNGENINTHLNRCWNVLCGKYNTVQLRSLSFIHLCCCHVIHAIARSLNGARIDKKIRQGILYIFAFILCGNDMKQLYDTLGKVIKIFGDPNEQNAKEIFEEMFSLQLDVDEETVSMLKDHEKIFEEAKKDNDELRMVDEYFRYNTPIIHQSPFNQEAIRRYPTLTTLINGKSKYEKVVNPLFSPSIIRIFYRWWAYLPLWTGLLWNFEERYSSNIQGNTSVVYNPIRHSNAIIESYFRTLKQSILGKKIYNRPGDIIRKINRSVNVQFKACKFNITQSSKGRKRETTDVSITKKEEWYKKGIGRGMYVGLIDKFASKRTRSKTNDAEPDIIMKKISESEECRTISSKSQSPLSFDESNDNISPKSNERNSISTSSKPNSKTSDKYPINISVSSNRSMADDDDDDRRSEASIELDSNADIESVITNMLYPICNGKYQYERFEIKKRTLNTDPVRTTDHEPSNNRQVQSSSHSETIIGDETLRWPTFEIHNTFFKGQSYNIILTCPIDSALFALYFIYRTDINIAVEFDSAPDNSSYSTLVKIFHIVETEGWDAARISWLLHFNLLKSTDRQPISLFGSPDAQVFCFIKDEQRYSYTSTCSRPDCTDKERVYTSTELELFSCDDHIEKFEIETMGVCKAMIKRLDEMTEAEALKRNCTSGRVPLINYKTNRSEYVNGWLCDCVNENSTATFDYRHPPIIIVTLKPLATRTKEGYGPTIVRLRDMKTTIRISSVEYKLRAVIHNKDLHFTATLIDCDNTWYTFDDQIGVRKVRTSTDMVEYAIYSQVYGF